MIREIEIRNFKKFKQLRFAPPAFSVIAGPNNSGKTSLLQAVAAWSEIGYRWRTKWRGGTPDLARNDGAYPTVRIDAADLRSVPVAQLPALWRDEIVTEPATIYVKTDAWTVGFEFVHDLSSGIVNVGPTRDTAESHITSYIDNPITALYISSFSGIEREENEMTEDAVDSLLAGGKGGKVLRNMLRLAHRHNEKWKRLNDAIKLFFGYELLLPSGGAPIVARYRHSLKGQAHDLASGASGFLQILMVHAALEYSDSSVLLIDEPDAHLHMLLKEKIYRHLRDHVRERNRQAIIVTHSSHMIDAAARDDGECLRGIAAENVNVIRRQDAKEAMRFETMEIANATNYGYVLYVEDYTDILILTAWAKVTNHPSQELLRSPNFVPTRKRRKKPGDVKKHFSAMKAVVPNLCGMDIRDRNGGQGRPGNVPAGLTVEFWGRYEIENYLIHPQAIMRFLKHEYGAPAAERAWAYMKEYLPPVRFTKPFADEGHDDRKGKSEIRRIMEAAGAPLSDAEFYRIAEHMQANEVHPHVKEMLDSIVSQLEK